MPPANVPAGDTSEGIYNRYTDDNYSMLLLAPPQRTYLASLKFSLGISAKFKQLAKLTKIQK